VKGDQPGWNRSAQISRSRRMAVPQTCISGAAPSMISRASVSSICRAIAGGSFIIHSIVKEEGSRLAAAPKVLLSAGEEGLDIGRAKALLFLLLLLGAGSEGPLPELVAQQHFVARLDDTGLGEVSFEVTDHNRLKSGHLFLERLHLLRESLDLRLGFQHLLRSALEPEDRPLKLLLRGHCAYSLVNQRPQRDCLGPINTSHPALGVNNKGLSGASRRAARRARLGSAWPEGGTWTSVFEAPPFVVNLT